MFVCVTSIVLPDLMLEDVSVSYQFVHYIWGKTMKDYVTIPESKETLSCAVMLVLTFLSTMQNAAI